jgi:hypothetical protein
MKINFCITRIAIGYEKEDLTVPYGEYEYRRIIYFLFWKIVL